MRSRADSTSNGAVRRPPPRSRRTRSGRSASTSEVSVRPAWASPPGTHGHHGRAARPSRSSVVIARSTASRLPPWPLTSTTPPDQSAERTSSTMTVAVASVPIDSVPGNPACSPLAVTVSDGPTTTPGRHAASRAARASADDRVGGQRQVRPVLLARADGDAQHRSVADRRPRRLRQLHIGDGNPSPDATHPTALTSRELEVVRSPHAGHPSARVRSSRRLAPGGPSRSPSRS